MKNHVNIPGGPINITARHIPNAGVLCNGYDRLRFRIFYKAKGAVCRLNGLASVLDEH
jgi:hypothetical protein